MAIIRLTELHTVSIHAPREGSDAMPGRRLPPIFRFNPRSPRGERPGWYRRAVPYSWVSIHAPREGSDLNHIKDMCPYQSFNPRSP